MRALMLHELGKPENLRLEDVADPAQKEVLGTLVGFWHTEIGELNKVIHIWGYDSLDDRLARRAALAEHPDWPAYLEVALPLIVEQENRVLIPASFSPDYSMF